MKAFHLFFWFMLSCDRITIPHDKWLRFRAVFVSFTAEESSLLRKASWSVEQSLKSYCQCPVVRRFQSVSGRCMAVPVPRPSLIPLFVIDFLHGFRRLTVPLFVNQYNWFDWFDLMSRHGCIWVHRIHLSTRWYSSQNRCPKTVCRFDNLISINILNWYSIW